MLRRNADNLLEFRQLEQVLATAGPPGLSDERREALRLRIFSQLDEQSPAPSGLRFLPPRERWVVFPAGAGLAAAVIAGAVLLAEQITASPDSGITVHVVGDVLVDGQRSSEVQPGAMLVARSSAWVSVGPGIRVGLERGAVVRYDYVNGSVALHLFAGEVTVATTKAGVNLNGEGWGAILGAGTLASASTAGGQTTFRVEEGQAALTVSGRTRTIGPQDPAVHIGASFQPFPTGSAPVSTNRDEPRPVPSVAVAGTRPADEKAPPVDPAAGVTTSPAPEAAGGSSTSTPGGGTTGQKPPELRVDGGPADPAASYTQGSAGSGSTSGGSVASPPASSGNSNSATVPMGNPHTAADPTGNPHTAADPTGNPRGSGNTIPAASPLTGPTPVEQGNSGNAPGHNQDTPGSGGTPTPVAATPTPTTPGNSGNAPGHNKGDSSGGSSSSSSGNSGNAPGHSKV